LVKGGIVSGAGNKNFFHSHRGFFISIWNRTENVQDKAWGAGSFLGMGRRAGGSHKLF